jgi:hypothetical protein
MAQTLHTMTNQMRQPVETTVCNIETLSSPDAKGDARSMRESLGVFGGEWDVDESRSAEVAEFVFNHEVTTCQNAINTTGSNNFYHSRIIFIIEL